MYKIALVCENGASTGMVVRKMREAAKKRGIEAEIQAYPYTQLENFIEEVDAILLGPQIAYKKDVIAKTFSKYADKIDVIKPMDFGMMNGEKILDDAITIIKK
ncbi:PTS sugar transporter subunit IIB [Thermoanaerobacterium saccharolyticum]|uniref:PTS sugar transporter subunit IIB n=1 Tax=Thermoanaerobacterium saccharolyticum TaxID=28896 RepID=UPI0004AF1478